MKYVQNVYPVPVFGCAISSEREAFSASQGQHTASSGYASVLLQNHCLSLFPTHPPAYTHTPSPHPSWIPAVGCCSALLQNGLSRSTSPLLSLYWNTKTCAWLPSHIGRSKPCMEADLVKSHRMAFLAGGIMPGIAMGHPEESITKCQSSGFMNAIHKVPWLLAFCKACCKTLRYSSVHTLKGGLFLSYSTVWAAWDPWGPKEDIMHSFTEAL